MRLIIDSHLDLAWNALQWNRDLTQPLADIRAAESHMKDKRGRGHGMVCLPELRRAGVAICLGTILVRTKPEVRPENGFLRTDLDFATQEIASAVGQGQLAWYRLMAQRGEMRLLKTAAELRDHWQSWQALAEAAGRPIGVILAMEGADPIAEPSQSQWWQEQGLRVVGLAHYGQGQYAAGTGHSGPLTPRGRELLKEFERLGIIVDLTHSCDESFFQALDAFNGPVLASHNNCRALVSGDRQFSDEQIKRLNERGAVIGVAMDSWMLTPGFKGGQTPKSQTPLSSVADQIDHICQLAGNTNHAAIGSDLDGGFGTEQTPAELDSIADLQKLEAILRSRGYDERDIDGIFHGNWLSFFLTHLPQ